MHGSPLQQSHGSQVGKLDCSDLSAAERQVDRVASRQFQQQSSGTTNMPRFGLSSSCRLSVYSWGKCIACGHSRSHTLSGSCCIRLAQAAKAFASVCSMRKTLWGIASDENGIDVNQDSHFRFPAASHYAPDRLFWGRFPPVPSRATPATCARTGSCLFVVPGSRIGPMQKNISQGFESNGRCSSA